MNDPKPTFGMIFLGGSLSGALIRDIRLANELADRGFDVHVWWAMDQPKDSPLRPSITEHHLFGGFRYKANWGRGLHEAAGQVLRAMSSDKSRQRSVQKRPQLIERMMGNLMRLIVDGIGNDPAVTKRFVAEVERAGVTHMLPMLGMLAPYAKLAREKASTKPKYLVTFQGYELYVHYARLVQLEQQLYEVMRSCANEADYPSITVSEDYRQRVIHDIGVPGEALVPLPPGVPTQVNMTRDEALAKIAGHFKKLDVTKPIVTFLGRRDVEKGIDLFLYAAKVLQERGVDVQPAVIGPTLFGIHYSKALVQIAVDLRLKVQWAKFVPDEVRDALFAGSRAVVYPSIHREPFGMVPVEAAAYGTPAVVPDYGGVQETVRVNGLQSGLHFKVWDSGDLADQIGRLITDQPLWQKLSADGPKIAEYYSVANLADRVLTHMQLPKTPA